MNIGLESNLLYKEISALNYNYVFIRNNIFLDRLLEDEFNNLKQYINDKNYNGIFQIVKNTYKRLISFESNYDDNKDVIYEINNPSMIAKNNALVIGVLIKNKNEDIDEFIKIKEKEYSEKLNIPVTIIVYTEEKIKKNNIYLINNLYEKEEQKAKEELKKYQKYIPIGSVVMLKGAWKKIMVTGYAPINPDTNEKMYDYMACLYPEGIISADYNILFNHDDIKQIYAIGLQDDEYKNFMEELFKD